MVTGFNYDGIQQLPSDVVNKLNILPELGSRRVNLRCADIAVHVGVYSTVLTGVRTAIYRMITRGEAGMHLASWGEAGVVPNSANLMVAVQQPSRLSGACWRHPCLLQGGEAPLALLLSLSPINISELNPIPRAATDGRDGGLTPLCQPCDAFAHRASMPA